MGNTIQFGETMRRPAPTHWGCNNLLATPILDAPLVVEHHYEPNGDMPEHAAHEAALCICIDGRGFVKVGDDTLELTADQAIVWPSNKTHKVWTVDSSMTVLLIHFPGLSDLKETDPSRTAC